MDKLDYKIFSDDEQYTNPSTYNYENATQLDLLYDVFDSQITFVIDGISFDYEDGDKVRMPLLDYFWSLTYLVGAFDAGERESSITFTESANEYSLMMNEGEVTVTCNWSDATAKIYYKQLRDIILHMVIRGLNECEFLKPAILKNKEYIEMKTLFLKERLKVHPKIK